jgi:hypothetical protein
MNEAINGALLAWAIVSIGGHACLWVSPGALRSVRLRLRAREHGLLASRAAYVSAYNASYEDEARAEALLRMDREALHAVQLENAR